LHALSSFSRPLISHFLRHLQRFDALEEKLMRESGIFGTRTTGAAAEGGLQSAAPPHPSASRVTALSSSSPQPSDVGKPQSHSAFKTATEAQVAALYDHPFNLLKYNPKPYLRHAHSYDSVMNGISSTLL
jgi:hypothetical protein